MKHVKTEMQRLATMVYTDLNSNYTYPYSYKCTYKCVYTCDNIYK